MDLAPHIKDLLTAYKSMPASPRRERIIKLLQESYLLATSDSLESFVASKMYSDRPSEMKGLKTAGNASQENRYDTRFDSSLKITSDDNDFQIGDLVTFRDFPNIPEEKVFKVSKE